MTSKKEGKEEEGLSVETSGGLIEGAGGGESGGATAEGSAKVGAWPESEGGGIDGKLHIYRAFFIGGVTSPPPSLFATFIPRASSSRSLYWYLPHGNIHIWVLARGGRARSRGKAYSSS